MRQIKPFLFVIFLCFNVFQVSAQLPTDCVDAVIVCGNSEVNLNVNGIGVQELYGSNTCGSQENNSLWLQVTLVTDGTLGFTLRPNSTSITEDYDFFVFGPNRPCNNIGQAIRCSTTNPLASGQQNNYTGMNGEESDTAEGPGQFGNSFVKWLDVTAGDTYFIVIDRPIGNSPFSLEWTGTAEFASPPTNEMGSPEALDLENCDTLIPLGNGETEFNLDINTSQIIGTQTDVAVSYHFNESDANLNIGTVASPYTNVSNPQTVYARLTNTNTGCFEIVPFNLSVTSPDFTTPSNYIVCDDYEDGDATNGQTFFDLPTKNNEILNGQDPANLTISYHELQIDAETDTNPLADIYYNTTADLQQIFVRIEDANNPDCASITTLDLEVLPIPPSNNSSLLQCDNDGINDNLTTFNLNEAITEITGGDTNLSTEFYFSSTDAETSNDPLNAENYNNISNPQTVYAQVTDNSTGCFSIAELTLEVSATQLLDYQAPEICDELGSEDGIDTFNLNDFAADMQVINGITFPITFYPNYQDALLEQNELTSPYTNTTPYNQTIYARAENNNACYGISEVYLTVNKLPILKEDESVLYCLNSFPQTIILEAGVLSDSPTNYTYIWSNGETASTIQINQIGTYTVTATDNFGCSKSRNITVEPSNTATFNDVIVVDATENNTITVLVSGEGEYEYALYNQDGLYRIYQSDNIFYNVYGGIYTVAVRDIKNNCGIVTQEVSIIGFPKFFTPNGDGYNDTWNIKGVSNIFQPNTLIRIFDRHGKLIKQLNPLGSGWDGTFNGEPLPTDDYWFSATLKDGREYNSHFSLKR
ncbi:T9SS type B sorting domain-containing protein [Xanthomarina sp. F1114]|uniref:T9SS type B sorting domain-containing protein n=1 Tax=Xanthomarina sp. F1114 TaxID=2996019 RepID=UPI00225E1707|nr:T9SS type B sorting domain-containing protein [Xanthomarina sp. F1114]MCX7547114.1 T9SS type B sorting domain-containing protein [Xanthomarina sp. F1114]